MIDIAFLLFLPCLIALICFVSPIAFANFFCILGSWALLAVVVVFIAQGYQSSFSFDFVGGLQIVLEMDFLGAAFSLMVAVMFVIASWYAVFYLKLGRESNRNRFLAFYTLSIGSTIALASSGNLITMFIFYELLTLVTYPLVVHAGTQEAKLSGRVYLSHLIGASLLLLLPAVAYTYFVEGDLGFEPLTTNDNVAKAILFMLFTYGTAKSALFPLHSWLPQAMVAPAPVSALLHAVAVVKSGVFVLIKVYLYLFAKDGIGDYNFIITYAAAVGIIFASLLALSVNTIKGRLAYSTVSQLSYMVMSASLLTPAGLRAAFLHMVNHSFAKISLFFVAGLIYVQSEIKLVEQMKGLANRMPICMCIFAVAALAIIGLPVTSVFWSKMAILSAMGEFEGSFFIAIVILGAVLNVGYFLPMMYYAFTGSDDKSHASDGMQGDPPLLALLPAVVTALVTVILFFFPMMFPELLQVFAAKFEWVQHG